MKRPDTPTARISKVISVGQGSQGPFELSDPSKPQALMYKTPSRQRRGTKGDIA